MFGKFWQSYGPWHLEFLHILAPIAGAHVLQTCFVYFLSPVDVEAAAWELAFSKASFFDSSSALASSANSSCSIKKNTMKMFVKYWLMLCACLEQHFRYNV